MRVAVGCDHAGTPLREIVADALRAAGHEPVDLGVADDYPDIALTVGSAVAGGDCERGVLVCGSGAGVAVAACKIEGVRAQAIHDEYTAHQAVEHDDVNVLCLGARVIGPVVAGELVTRWANARFSGEERHVRRLAKVLEIEREGLAAELDGIT